MSSFLALGPSNVACCIQWAAAMRLLPHLLTRILPMLVLVCNAQIRDSALNCAVVRQGWELLHQCINANHVARLQWCCVAHCKNPALNLVSTFLARSGCLTSNYVVCSLNTCRLEPKVQQVPIWRHPAEVFDLLPSCMWFCATPLGNRLTLTPFPPTPTSEGSGNHGPGIRKGVCPKRLALSTYLDISMPSAMLAAAQQGAAVASNPGRPARILNIRDAPGNEPRMSCTSTSQWTTGPAPFLLVCLCLSALSHVCRFPMSVYVGL